jgi:hypothetical protein
MVRASLSKAQMERALERLAELQRRGQKATWCGVLDELYGIGEDTVTPRCITPIY